MAPIVIPTLQCLSCTSLPPTNTPTLDYAKLGLPSPTSTPTLDYAKLASHYLTPFTPHPRPTLTGFPSWTPTSKPVDIWANIKIRKLLSAPPSAPLAIDYCGISSGQFNFAPRPCEPNSLSSYIQTITDLMNSIDGNSKLYTQAVNSWTPNGRNIVGETWLIKDNVESSGQPVLLASVPVYFRVDMPICCGQIILLFEKRGNLYKPVYLVAVIADNQSGITIALMDDLNNDGYEEVGLESTSCGSACATDVEIREWDGQNWRDEGWLHSDMNPQISTLDH